MNRTLILASKSPRRSFLLEQAGIPFEVRTRDIEEVYPDSLPSKEVAAYLAELKAEGVRDFIVDNEIVLTADSVVIYRDLIFGKPKNYEDAFAKLKAMSGNMHKVVTGVCLLSANRKITFSVETDVYFKSINDKEIEYYIKKFQPYDKAGAYGIQEWIGYTKIERIEGSYSNVMGLPIAKVYEALKLFGI